MKSVKYIILLNFLFFGVTAYSFDAVGHRIIADIAYQNLHRKAQKQVDKILGKHGIVFESSWADEVRSDKKYAYSYQWHYQNLDDHLAESDIKMLLANPSAKGEHLFFALDSLIHRLIKDKNDAEALKFLVHFVGDMHQPMHLGRKEDLGGNKVETKWFGRTINIHSLWDSHMIDFKKMSYSEYSNYLQDKYAPKKNEFKKYSILLSVEASYTLRNEIYNYDTNDKNNYHYTYLFSDKLDEMLYRGGMQLANVLNTIYK